MWLHDILEFFALAKAELNPGSSSGTGRSDGITLGLRIDALDFLAGNDVLPRLLVWERSWREALDLPPQPSRLRHDGTTGVVVAYAAAVAFLTTHRTWAYANDPEVAEFHGDLQMLHGQAQAAARANTTRIYSLDCPGLGGECDGRMKLHDLAMDEVQVCRTCGGRWQTRRLVLDALLARGDVELSEADLALLLSVAPTTLRKWFRAGKVARNGGMYNLSDAAAEYDEAIASGRLTRHSIG